jgi:predicted phage-related endonuclease
MTTIIMTNKSLESEIAQIRTLEAKINELDELKKEKEALIKSVLDSAGVEEMKIGAFTVRFTNVVRNNFNTTAFKKKYLELYNAFIKQSNYRKFTIV